MRNRIGRIKRRGPEYPAFFYTALFAFVGDALDTIQEKKWPDFVYSHPTLAIRANLDDWRGSHEYPEVGHDVFPFARNVPGVCGADTQTGPTIKVIEGRTLCDGVPADRIMIYALIQIKAFSSGSLSSAPFPWPRKRRRPLLAGNILQGFRNNPSPGLLLRKRLRDLS